MCTFVLLSSDEGNPSEKGGIILIQIELVVPKIISFLFSGPRDWDYKALDI